jgi:hypothetical protein
MFLLGIVPWKDYMIILAMNSAHWSFTFCHKYARMSLGKNMTINVWHYRLDYV